MFSGTIQFTGIGAVSVNGSNSLSELIAKLQAAVDAKEATVAPTVAQVAAANAAMQS